MTLTIGTILENRYRVDALLGQGGMGAVYQGYDTRLLNPVAIKENFFTTPEAQRQFEREAIILSRLRHPSLPRVIDHFSADGAQYLVMDFVEGADLHEMLVRGGTISETQALAWLSQICDAVEYLHAQNPPVIHRDIKPQNIKITPEGRAVLVDFGIVKIGTAEMLTTTGARAVTPGYSPPEQYGTGGTDARSDVYSLAATLYTLLTGKTPPEGIQLSIRQAQLIPPRQLNPQVSPEVEAAILRGMDSSPTGRPQSAAEFRALWRGGTPSPPAPLPKRERGVRPPSAPPAAKLPLWVWPVAGFAGVVIVGLVIMMLLGGGNQGDATPVAAGFTPAPTQTSEVSKTSEVSTATDTPEPSATVKVAPTDTPRPTATKTLVPPTATTQPTATPRPTWTAVPTSKPQLEAGAVRISGQDGAEMVYVPAGEFTMGSTEAEVDFAMELCSKVRDDCERDWFTDESPQHTVYVDAFWVDKYEVTNAQFKKCVDAGKCTAPTECDWGDPTYQDAGKADHPVVCVDWESARQYCEWAGKRLPTEAEWEKAARGTEGRRFPWGNDFAGRKLNYCDANCEFDWKDSAVDDGYARTAPVGSYPAGASPYGARDMAGNVWEWTADWFAGDYYASSPTRNPPGPASGKYKVIRGGSWIDDDYGVRVASRYYGYPTSTYVNLGLRCLQ